MNIRELKIGQKVYQVYDPYNNETRATSEDFAIGVYEYTVIAVGKDKYGDFFVTESDYGVDIADAIAMCGDRQENVYYFNACDEALAKAKELALAHYVHSAVNEKQGE